MKRIAVLVILMLGFIFISCSSFNDENGSVTLQLPGSSSARSISTSGSIPDDIQIEAYEIRVRNSDNEMNQKITGATPGSTVTIDNLNPDTYKISVLAYYANGSNDIVSYYGITTVEVRPKQETLAAVTMRDFDNSGSYPAVNIYPSGTNFFTAGFFDFSCTVTGNGVNFTYTGSATGYDGKVSGFMGPTQLDGIPNNYWHNKKETFLEPGFAYTFNITVTKNSSEIHSGSLTKIIEQSNYQNQNDHTINVYVN